MARRSADGYSAHDYCQHTPHVAVWEVFCAAREPNADFEAELGRRLRRVAFRAYSAATKEARSYARALQHSEEHIASRARQNELDQ